MKDAEVPKAIRGRGRQPLLTPETQKKLLDEITLGASYADACLLVGISPATLLMWRRKGEAQKKGIYRNFLVALDQARAKRRRWYRADIAKKATEKKDWRGIAYLASVTEPEAFAARVHVVVEQEFSAAIDRLKKEFAGDHQILERALSALVGETRSGGTAIAAGDASEAVAALGQSVDPASTIAAAVGVPGADV